MDPDVSEPFAYVDVHTHLTHEMFEEDRTEVIDQCGQKGMGAVVVNGLEPSSNRSILEMANKFPFIKPALGIYPVDAVWQMLPQDTELRYRPFDVATEIDFIEKQAQLGKIVAVGECGMDAFCLSEDTFIEQERVFSALVDIAKRYHLPVIIHSRKIEKRVMEIVASINPSKVIFHCFSGKSKLALQGAENHDWNFSIPTNAVRDMGFQKLLRNLPARNILTETDAPYLSPEKNTRNIPVNVILTIDLLAKLRNLSHEKAKFLVWDNYRRLFD